jgi:uncharacterized alkaline shock family protein YloU
MAMTPTPPDGDDHAILALEPEDLDGHTIDELADYLDAGMLPADPSIDDSPACQNALAAIVRVRSFADDAIEADALDDAAREPDRGDGWVQAIMQNISLDAVAGRDIPIGEPAAPDDLVITEGSVRSLIRRAGDAVEGILIGRCSLDGDVTVPGAVVRVHVGATILWGYSIPEVTERVRAAISHELLKHTRLEVAGIDIDIRDLHVGPDQTQGIGPA